MSMTSKVRPYKFGFGPFAPEVYRLPYPYAYRGHYSGPAAAARELEDFFQTQVAAEKVACVVVELVAGEGGFIVAPREWVDLLAGFCRAHGILLVVDEVQTGFGRTGRLFACEHYGLEPDLLTMAKSLAGGFPLSAVTGRAEVMDTAHVGGLGGTYTGNPVSCAAALAAIDHIERERLPERAARIGEEVGRRFQCFVERFPFVGDARGLGAMRALELVQDRGTKAPDKDRTDRVIRRACETGLLLVGAGTYGNVIRTLMPLVVTDAELTEGLDVLEKALESA
jgi:4-aminobutyrate aminotransferase/(S)-3-amino-2-methylpropionate transaminase